MFSLLLDYIWVTACTPGVETLQLRTGLISNPQSHGPCEYTLTSSDLGSGKYGSCMA